MTTIVLLGAPGAGKGTQAAILSEKLGIPHVTSGGLFRAMREQDTPLARKVQKIMASGDLVPDDITIEIVRNRITQPDASEGVILDGFPRTLPQAEALDELLASLGRSVDLVPYFKVSEEEVLARLGGRWICTQDESHVYHERYNPPQKPGICDEDGAPLYQREDDKPEAIRKRFQVYQERTAPLIAYYRERGVLVEIDAEQGIEDVTAALLKVVGEETDSPKASDAGDGRVTIKLVKSPIGYSTKQKETVRSLGLRKLNQVVEHADTPAIRGMIDKVGHLVEVTES
jgi:adenylate kinase